ncbi:hypothetical protein RhiirA5_218498 [Rhizophagus irregularis]|uniref:Aurora kinase n=2 Tax=Rhizophagus irregularis TaxID=588596 RepID=A0A2I1EVB0_9GLOM|nr:hypothetical protein GLOIN_2v1500020 [Rhizophagus irregularis DAOM 181602=DAOM 197198]PKC05777.1 hypothetical protein RhiirA5_218498 [Rhizophagus irregularis]PKY26064.1 hypothetical protein RhiirB3_371824 [Rhizophagus irregularis]POG82219.1 hypothetical protein GLOIN_2v1500020 [Rhizophagus irregularis DAOM 181602=DAOM 197198]|eukprot:XP_025189085.1 hypothetical protein GLOIN_2v1500020 [Rhizophagus irregularis DAOM 181602=DAOM 197198]
MNSWLGSLLLWFKVDYKIPNQISSEAKNLISSLLQSDPEKRLPLDHVTTHPWILKNK